MEILAAYIREKAAMKNYETSIEGISEEIQAALTVIKRRNITKDPKYASLDLSRTYLKRANLKGEMIEDINFWKYSLKSSNLSNIDFTKANLSEADFSGANLINSNFTDANLASANFAQAFTEKANFSLANLTNVKGLSQANTK